MYTVGQKQYHHSTRHLGPFVDHELEAKRLISAADGGQAVDCYVRYDKPGQAVLSRDVSMFRLVLSFVFVGGFCFAGACILVGCFSKRYAHQFV
ncbi:MAG: hypothetical protein AAGJ83_10850 [Planctomycetota bacterium]